MTTAQIIELVKSNGSVVDEIEVKDFGTVIRSCGLKLLDSARLEIFKQGHETPISCHREEGSCEAFMIVWNK